MTTAVAQELGNVLVVVLDRAHARFFEVTPAGTTELQSLQSPAMRGGRFHSDRQGGPGWGEHEYHGRIQEEERRHIDAIVQRLQRLDRERPAEEILLAGPGPATAALAEALPSPLSARVLRPAHFNTREVTPAQVERAARAALTAHRETVERGLVAAMEAGLGRARATNGARETLRAVAHDQVRTLLVAANFRGSGFRCSTSGRLVPSAGDCMGEGEPVPVPDLVAAAIEDARRHGATVEVIHDAALLPRIDGLAALLRYAR